MRIGIDCRLSGPTHAGIGRYIENLLIRLPTLQPTVEWVFIFYDKKQSDDILSRADKKWRNALQKVEVVYAPIRHYTVDEQLHFPTFLGTLNLDLLHVPHFNIPLFYKGNIVVTIHDLLWHEYKGTAVTTLQPWIYWFKYAAYKFVASQAIARAKTVFVPAQTIKNTLNHYYPAHEKKVVITKEGIDDRLLQYKKINVKQKDKSLLYVGSLYPHKNIRVVIEALRQLSDWKLTIVGARSAFQADIQEFVETHKLEKQVTFTGFLDDEKLAAEIQSATALVQPSFSEGFGLTGLEAMALGTPVIASNIPIFKEIYQDAAVFFDPHSVSEFIESLEKIDHSKRWQEKAQKIVKQYSWDEMVQKTVEYYGS
jgi:glycosyltransferase involved in cell wall biosynthesis